MQKSVSFETDRRMSLCSIPTCKMIHTIIFLINFYSCSLFPFQFRLLPYYFTLNRFYSDTLVIYGGISFLFFFLVNNCHFHLECSSSSPPDFQIARCVADLFLIISARINDSRIITPLPC